MRSRLFLTVDKRLLSNESEQKQRHLIEAFETSTAAFKWISKLTKWHQFQWDFLELFFEAFPWNFYTKSLMAGLWYPNDLFRCAFCSSVSVLKKSMIFTSMLDATAKNNYFVRGRYFWGWKFTQDSACRIFEGLSNSRVYSSTDALENGQVRGQACSLAWRWGSNYMRSRSTRMTCLISHIYYIP